MYAPPITESDGVQGADQAKGTIEVADILVDWS